MAAQSIQIFTFREAQTIRTFIDNNDEIWFCRKDVLDVLGLDRTTNLLDYLDPKGVVINHSLTQGGKQKLVYINEPNLYRIIFKSTKAEAKHFQDWIFNEVLPALRKHGHYEIPSAMQQPKDELSDKDLSKIRDCIYTCANQFTYDRAFVSGAWYALRKATGVKSPDKFGYKHLDIIAKELQHMQHIADMYAKVKFKVEEELIKKCVRENGTTGELFEILSNMIVQLTNCDFDKIRQLKGSTSDLMLDM